MRARLSSNASDYSSFYEPEDLNVDNFMNSNLDSDGDLSFEQFVPDRSMLAFGKHNSSTIFTPRTLSGLEALSAQSAETDDYYGDSESGNKEETYLQKVRNILGLAVPAMLCLLAEMVQENINLIFIGHLNDAEQMAGVGMGNMIQNMFGLSIVCGFNGAMETLVSQAYGSGNIQLCGVYLNRGRFVLLVAFIPISCVLYQSEKILVALGQNPRVAMYAQQYIIFYLPGLILAGLLDGQRRFLNMLGKCNVPMVAQCTGQIFHVFLSWLFVWKLNYGIVGTGIASAMTNSIIYAIVLFYTTCLPEIQEANTLPDKKTFANIGQYLVLGLPTAAMMCLEWWAYEVMTLMAGYIGVNEQAAQLVLMNIVAMLYMISLGIQQAATSTIGNKIGEQNLVAAKEYYRVLNHVSLITVTAATIGFVLHQEFWVSLFTNIAEVRQCCTAVVGFAAAGIFPDLWQGYLQGVIKALGIQGRVIYINLIAYWLLNIPLCWYFSFYCGFGYAGVWMAMISAQFFISVSFQLLINAADWEKSAQVSKDRQMQELVLIKQRSSFKKERTLSKAKSLVV